MTSLFLSNITSNPSSSTKLPQPIHSQGEENKPAKENAGIDCKYGLSTLGSVALELAKRKIVSPTSPTTIAPHTHLGNSAASGFNTGFGATAMRWRIRASNPTGAST